MASEREISGKSFIITGAGRGLGAAFAEAFLKEGAKHVAILDVSDEAGRAQVSRLGGSFGAGAVSFVPCDVSNEAQLSAAYDAVLLEQGAVDVVVNNAGIFDEGQHRKMIDVNFAGLVASTYKAFEVMRKDRSGVGGTIINVASMGAFVANHYMPVYCATKSAVLSFSNSLGLPERYNSTGVRVLAICYGITDTAIMRGMETRVYDDEAARDVHLVFDIMPMQSVEAATRGMLDMFRGGASGSTWISSCDKPAKDVTSDVNEGRQHFLNI